MTHTISVKLAGKVGRIRIEGTNLGSKISDFRQRVHSVLTQTEKQDVPDKFNLVYCGKLLKDESTLEESGVKPGSTIHILKLKLAEEEPKLDPMDETDIRQLMTALHAALLNPSHRQAVHKILTSAETIDNIIAATPGMSADHVAVSMLRDPQLLVQVADPENVRSIVREHPAIGHAVMNIAASVNEEAAHSSRSGSMLGQDPHFGLFSDATADEDMDISEAGPSTASGQRSQGGITAAQLAAALTAAGVGRGPETRGASLPQTGFLRPFESTMTNPSDPSTSASSDSASGSSSSTSAAAAAGRITSSILQQALAQAMQTAQPEINNTLTTAGSNDSSTPRDFTVQLQQLREMGITDEAASIRALEATDGNVDAVLHIFFDGDI
ncbi:putative ubiquitin-like protein 7 isoform X1 [Apostichopus japonicus]|uniref:Putative ubiquitin-like protein 7 isoform X1 n=1 Tax=Stichopus japonicus TaxID=307972 RepID=A0A2G8LA39_STIJA|nr:putative ubiquitin-like protein 7 isoform X1 [Apostichopus japonicus]